MMARPRSPEKRNAILRAAVCEIAQVGLGASTARIAQGAGLAEGTIFTYFPTKEDLLNELYLELKTTVHEVIHRDFPHDSQLSARIRHIWTEYLRWAMENPQDQQVSVLLNLSTAITPATKERLASSHGAVAQTMDELGQCGAFRDLPRGFASAAMLAMQEAMMSMEAKSPRARARLVDQTFEAFWRLAL